MRYKNIGEYLKNKRFDEVIHIVLYNIIIYYLVKFMI